MIRVHKLNGQEVILNAEMIECIEPHGKETVIGLVNGNRAVVAEEVSEVVARCIEYRKTVYAGSAYVPEFLKKPQAL